MEEEEGRETEEERRESDEEEGSEAMKTAHDEIVYLLENVRIRQAIASAENGNHRSKESTEETLEMLGRSPFYSLKEKESIESKIAKHL